MKTTLTVAALALAIATPAFAQDAKPATTPPIAPMAKPAETPKAQPAASKDAKKVEPAKIDPKATAPTTPTAPKADAGKDAAKTTEKPAETKKQ